MVTADSGYCYLRERFEFQRSQREPSLILERVSPHSATGMETRSLVGLQLLVPPTVLPAEGSEPCGQPLKRLPISYHVPQPDVLEKCRDDDAKIDGFRSYRYEGPIRTTCAARLAL